MTAECTAQQLLWPTGRNSLRALSSSCKTSVQHAGYFEMVHRHAHANKGKCFDAHRPDMHPLRDTGRRTYSRKDLSFVYI